MHAREIRVQAQLHPTGLWVTVPLTVDGRVTLWMVLDTGSPASAISPTAEQTLLDSQLVRAAGEQNRQHVLTGVAVQGQALPDLRVRVMRRLGRFPYRELGGLSLAIDGLLGLDFLSQFEDIHFNVSQMRLLLTGP